MKYNNTFTIEDITKELELNKFRKRITIKMVKIRNAIIEDMEFGSIERAVIEVNTSNYILELRRCKNTHQMKELFKSFLYDTAAEVSL